ncbi:MAG: hypothetical protein ABL931_20315 [Usitatibacteraceae bacterium]
MLKNFLVACEVALALSLGVAYPAGAASVRPMLLDEIIDTSAVAFQGTCVANRSERDPLTNYIVTYTTFEVRDVIKGGVPTTHVIKQEIETGELGLEKFKQMARKYANNLK